MRLADVEDLRERLSASDSDGVLSKLAGLLNAATLYLEESLDTQFAQNTSYDIFYIDETDPKAKGTVIRLTLDNRFIVGDGGDPEVFTITGKSFNTAKGAWTNDPDGTDLTIDEDFKLDADRGEIILLSSYYGKFLRFDYDHGFPFQTNDEFEDLEPQPDVDDLSPVPEWLEEAAIAYAARIYQSESREVDELLMKKAMEDVDVLIQNHKRFNVNSYTPIK